MVKYTYWILVLLGAGIFAFLRRASRPEERAVRIRPHRAHNRYGPFVIPPVELPPVPGPLLPAAPPKGASGGSPQKKSA